MDEQKEPHDGNSVSDHSSLERTDDVTPGFKFKVACDDADVIMAAETTMSGSDLDDDFVRHSTSSDEQKMQNVPPGLKETLR